MRPTRWRRSTHALIGVAVLVLVAAVVAVAAVVTGGSPDAAAGKPLPAPVTAKPAVVPVADTAPRPEPARLAAALAPALADPNLGKFTGRVSDALTGAELWSQGATVPMQPASTNKTLTAAAALLTLPRDARLTTRVLAGERPGVVVLKGGGDPTLSAAPPDEDTWYRDAARISDLAEQVRRAGISPTAVEVDISAYSGPTMAPGWDPLDIDGGDIAPMEAVMLDGGRTQPVSFDSRRSHTPALDAGRALAAALGVDPNRVTVLRGPARTTHEIGSVQSPPLIDRLRDMMYASDNVMAEAIGREVAAATGRPQSFAGAVEAVLDRLRSVGINTAGARLFDSSGLSVDNRLTALTLDDVVNAAAGDRTPALRPLVELLPIAGGSGTLSNRYLDTEAGRAATGFLRAKTGSLTGTNTLAGIVTDRSGRVLTFALISNDAGPMGRVALDNVAAVLRSCGCSR
ncbi:D-alanyl-D-alanine carboxypeptidase/D-alanyl-D-alanine-endopeptidase [Mycolicibacterium hassiacum DSM 44199]|jgi:D-alanyl-D-alanine carboxypeptidase/D-alanyl-D-alanine-endopeptidase (penicillin-binding protein 4)|uniref:D-alanyl-D-alanine carboxypeptidase/D-alanyl-D-alanine-endopeptidase n=1 Tax=Mycolicibacterium hassiacum (strain DSM 44199 / CIP 105218 / JCM 12690 / 3849) TaxID=1122247 RepID=K5BD99_MYCHD|nr:D-alanyl-D-alanine carboxypeptidase/D-alanyl-D-alanine-endopeptidase [Mycolicibacterium hassiacum]EKF22087.1 D-alanyl-D-alanine carboxypeptidase/D-alanyl-D-alanine-endopeptidase [Mycolicibacterium hassiacum DSM 44199]MBX5488598.1 D-alanyl-D-alanine carboxypeptidase/D-alanyl-D-alanine-endopeptidase [Mycolicibacterium hassiacum]MDA4086923.1 D-alanyl-D-alanine carboxypeptidase [Mycolicibacterium hassiacum DSM 44199]VCT92111.1 D-alanyl-D-alanine carboxypeptidase DacB [Mycolicibacterium hassiacum